ncbi:LL-diaminopimelate aminotransferase [Oleidesulfovibrio alaskensis G20]|jgi:alanine-synthesizing transaminase|uniref:Aminotransferase n=1 Tax=Oleidesulfovibrio alaskensis (strain ATCC BAA-1058 / DSM 17464 / G20) TaxID=207559 RepID=Q30XS0_OLEA2|nr:aminotransferase class I/II-fold pyridoxal phosphate-dependent enzyme [Oleidesulfovibrio alaskensis]ABB39526.1 LL-diaminopimelate aminotransferase [Oleidesulfovibrio alaskensis G20]MBG0772408.1 aminotransferase class I/II-fold pyridoxal phosphate-dependent enzyme [Oleidesulfovibrio alaskensis]MBL3582230.1 aminotransferase class I/II-fold pyridoxal phosphate-dependent enzyme [Oleidesulfovibrio alaskensis]
MYEFPRMHRLPPYVFAVVGELKMQLRRQNVDIVDMGMGNPDMPTPQHIVEKLNEAAAKGVNHRYSVSRGIPNLRKAICEWYMRKFDVYLDPDKEAVVTMGAKEGLSHLALAMLSPGDVVFAPDPTYPIHTYAAIIAGADVRRIPIGKGRDFFEDLLAATRQTWPQPKLLMLSYPHNPTTELATLEFFQKVVDFAKEHKMYVVHDMAYADLAFDGYEPPSFMQADGAKDVGVEFYSMSKSYSMAGWRVGFCVGNREMVHALTRIKSYLDYGIFQPIQIAATVALNGPEDCVKEIVDTYRQRRDVLCEGLNRVGWPIEPPKATMFAWAEIPEPFRQMGSVEFSKLLLREAGVAVSPGLGFGHFGDHHVRFALIENPHRIKQAIKGIKRVLSGSSCG